MTGKKSSVIIPDIVKTIEKSFYKSVEKALKFGEENPENSCGIHVDIFDGFRVILNKPKEGRDSLFGTLPEPTTEQVEENFEIPSSDLQVYVEFMGYDTKLNESGNYSWKERRMISAERSHYYLKGLIERDILKQKM